jgi:hypothetical protein
MKSSDPSDIWAFAIVFGILPIAFMIAAVLVQRLKTQERLRAIEKGLPLPPDTPLTALAFRERKVFNATPREVAAAFRVGGTICVAVGLGLLVLFTALAETIPEFKKGVIAVSAVPFFLGVGFLIEYRLRRKEIESREQSR